MRFALDWQIALYASLCKHAKTFPYLSTMLYHESLSGCKHREQRPSDKISQASVISHYQQMCNLNHNVSYPASDKSSLQTTPAYWHMHATHFPVLLSLLLKKPVRIHENISHWHDHDVPHRYSGGPADTGAHVPYMLKGTPYCGFGWLQVATLPQLFVSKKVAIISWQPAHSWCSMLRLAMYDSFPAYALASRALSRAAYNSTAVLFTAAS